MHAGVLNVQITVVDNTQIMVEHEVVHLMNTGNTGDVHL